MDKVRCFIALDLPETFRREIVKIQNILREEDLFLGKFTEPENLHLTLKFLGEIDEEKVNKVRERLKEVLFEEFSASFGEIGVFSEKFIRIIWIHLIGAENLQKKIDEKLSGLFEKEKRFMSHITIARVKRVKDKNKLMEFLRGISYEKKKFRIDRFYLLKSELFPEGPVYSLIGEYKCMGKIK